MQIFIDFDKVIDVHGKKKKTVVKGIQQNRQVPAPCPSLEASWLIISVSFQSSLCLRGYPPAPFKSLVNLHQKLPNRYVDFIPSLLPMAI